MRRRRGIKVVLDLDPSVVDQQMTSAAPSATPRSAPAAGSQGARAGSRCRGPRYTPVSRRQDRPNAILWLVRNHPELKDAQIMRLVGTTKTTIAQIRDRTHWNSANLAPADPVTLGLCSQIELDMEVEKAGKASPEKAVLEQTLLVEETTSADALAGFHLVRARTRTTSSMPTRCSPSSTP